MSEYTADDAVVPSGPKYLLLYLQRSLTKNFPEFSMAYKAFADEGSVVKDVFHCPVSDS